jgi:hypothetical protein
MVVQVGARIHEDWVMGARLRHRLPAEYSRSDVIRFCMALAAGMDRYDAMREAESLRRETAAKVEDSGYTAVTANMSDELLTRAMSTLETSNVSFAVRYAIGLANEFSLDAIKAGADRGPRGRKPKTVS